MGLFRLPGRLKELHDDRETIKARLKRYRARRNLFAVRTLSHRIPSEILPANDSRLAQNLGSGRGGGTAEFALIVSTIAIKTYALQVDQKTCRFCSKEYLESENFNWSCRTHRSEFGGEMWWCCGKLGRDAPGCKSALAVLLSIGDTPESQREARHAKRIIQKVDVFNLIL